MPLLLPSNLNPLSLLLFSTTTPSLPLVSAFTLSSSFTTSTEGGYIPDVSPNRTCQPTLAQDGSGWVTIKGHTNCNIDDPCFKDITGMTCADWASPDHDCSKAQSNSYNGYDDDAY